MRLSGEVNQLIRDRSLLDRPTYSLDGYRVALTRHMITDLFATSQRFNVPGAVSESNWSQRLLSRVSECRQNPATVEKMDRIRDLLRASGRLD